MLYHAATNPRSTRAQVGKSSDHQQSRWDLKRVHGLCRAPWTETALQGIARRLVCKLRRINENGTRITRLFDKSNLDGACHCMMCLELELRVANPLFVPVSLISHKHDEFRH